MGQEQLNIELQDEDRALKLIGLELMFDNPQKRKYSEGITAVELAKRINVDIDTVKKKLKVLNEKGLVRYEGMSPKFWRFNDYNFQRMDIEDPIYLLLCNFEDIDFDRFFSYG